MISNNFIGLGIIFIAHILFGFIVEIIYKIASFPGITEQNIIISIGFILSLLYFTAAGFYLLKNQGSRFKNFLSLIFILIIPLLDSLLNIILSTQKEGSGFFINWMFAPPVSLDALAVMFNSTIDKEPRVWLLAASVIIPVLFMWIGIQLQGRKTKRN